MANFIIYRIRWNFFACNLSEIFKMYVLYSLGTECSVRFVRSIFTISFTFIYVGWLALFDIGWLASLDTMFTEPTHTRYENKTITYENSWRLDRNQWKFIINESFCVLKLMFTLFSCPKLLLYIADRSMGFQYSWIQLHIQYKLCGSSKRINCGSAKKLLEKRYANKINNEPSKYGTEVSSMWPTEHVSRQIYLHDLVCRRMQWEIYDAM